MHLCREFVCWVQRKHDLLFFILHCLKTALRSYYYLFFFHNILWVADHVLRQIKHTFVTLISFFNCHMIYFCSLCNAWTWTMFRRSSFKVTSKFSGVIKSREPFCCNEHINISFISKTRNTFNQFNWFFNSTWLHYCFHFLLSNVEFRINKMLNFFRTFIRSGCLSFFSKQFNGI